MFWRVLCSWLDFHHRGWENLIFVKFLYGISFFCFFALDVGPVVAKITCIQGGFHDVHALFHIVVHSVQAKCLIKCLLGIFLLIWILMSTKF